MVLKVLNDIQIVKLDSAQRVFSSSQRQYRKALGAVGAVVSGASQRLDHVFCIHNMFASDVLCCDLHSLGTELFIACFLEARKPGKQASRFKDYDRTRYWWGRRYVDAHPCCEENSICHMWMAGPRRNKRPPQMPSPSLVSLSTFSLCFESNYQQALDYSSSTKDLAIFWVGVLHNIRNGLFRVPCVSRASG
jgi:hypothetical protein